MMKSSPAIPYVSLDSAIDPLASTYAMGFDPQAFPKANNK